MTFGEGGAALAFGFLALLCIVIGAKAHTPEYSFHATLFAIDEVNRAGGVLGRPVQPVVVDGQSDWPTFAREAERLITEEKVCTIFGCWSSAKKG